MSRYKPEDKISRTMFVAYSLACVLGSGCTINEVANKLAPFVKQSFPAEHPGQGEGAIFASEEWKRACRNLARQYAEAVDAHDASISDHESGDALIPYESFTVFVNTLMANEGTVAAILKAVAATINPDVGNYGQEVQGSIRAAVKDWVARCSGDEQSRRTSAIRQFASAVKLDFDDPAKSLAGISPSAARAFVQYVQDNPRRDRGQRLAHVQAFLDVMRDTGIAVPVLDWEGAKARAGIGA